MKKLSKEECLNLLSTIKKPDNEIRSELDKLEINEGLFIATSEYTLKSPMVNTMSNWFTKKRFKVMRIDTGWNVIRIN